MGTVQYILYVGSNGTNLVLGSRNGGLDGKMKGRYFEGSTETLEFYFHILCITHRCLFIDVVNLQIYFQQKRKKYKDQWCPNFQNNRSSMLDPTVAPPISPF